MMAATRGFSLDWSTHRYNKGTVVHVLDYAPRLQEVGGSGGTVPHILHLDINFKRVVSFKPGLLHPLRRSR